ncbi:hypothetical protein K466DRAFT_176259 [Polyporus arcularius HHB13444]|uniref:Uncharacterized protein n=1 Tax=Polyporus arcularius HHB13444 TaxID=1314778 RepID=A0A5C3PXZ0_9APHY|nr:hypothetical protein K466DRAFT_176259 [Polyporus arcularius HHB13444]
MFAMHSPRATDGNSLDGPESLPADLGGPAWLGDVGTSGSSGRVLQQVSCRLTFNERLLHIRRHSDSRLLPYRPIAQYVRLPRFSPDQRDIPQVATISYQPCSLAERAQATANPLTHRAQGARIPAILCISGHLCVSAWAPAHRPGSVRAYPSAAC